MKGKSQQNSISTSTSEVSLGDPLKDGSDEEEKHIPEPQTHSDGDHASALLPIDSKQTADDETIQQKRIQSEESERTLGEAEKQIVVNDLSPETPAEGEDGWQPVQRPRSAGLYGRRLRQRRSTISKVLGYQRKDDVSDMDHHKLKNNYQSSRYYLLKKRAMSPGSYADYYVAKTPSPGTKFGRRVVRAVTYRIKSVSSSVKEATTESSQNGSEVLSSLENGTVSASKDVGKISNKSSIVTLGRSPSYKEVAVAPPGSIPLLQARASHNQASLGEELQDIREQHDEAQENCKKSIETDEEKMKEEKMKENVKVEAVQDLPVDSVDNLKDAKEATRKEEEILLQDSSDKKDSEAMSSSVVTGHSNYLHVDEIEQEDVQISSKLDSVDSHMENRCEKDTPKTYESENHSDCISQGVDDVRIKPSISCTSDTRELTNKKLSASAAPFNPSPAAARIAPLPINITHPGGPGTVPAIGPWPMNMPLHPGPATVLPGPICSSPHHPYPSPPPTPNMIHTVPIMYPPYTQPPSLTPSPFPVTSGPFHPNHFAWQRNMNPGASDYIPGTVWPVCHPIEFSLSPPVVEPISEPTRELKGEPDNSESLGLAPNLPTDLNTGDEDKKEINLPASEAVETLNDMPTVHPENQISGMSNLHSIPFPGNQLNNNYDANGDAEKCGEYHACRHQKNNDNEKTFNILIRGKRNRKQTLRMPISLLKRPYSSQSFKVVYSRVIRETGSPISAGFPSDGTAKVTAA